ncbi:MAG: GTP cyclohydrolase II [Gammaproteobacteria bacterium]|nr:GTP cyclohydrolase II [Gammaproteobacteria bacterium]
MFSYVDKTIRENLEKAHLLVAIDESGNEVPSDSKGALMSVLGPVPLPRKIQDQQVTLEWYPFVRKTELGHVLAAAHQVEDGNSEEFRNLLQTHMSINSVFALPGFREAEDPLVRIHSCCLTGDIFGSQRCDCGPQLEGAFEKMLEEGNGAVVYMSGHEGRGIGLWAKAITYLLQDSGQDTYQANVALGLPEDSRDFSDAAFVLKYLLKGKPVRLLSNNPTKREHLEKYQQKVSQVVPLVAGVSEHNLRYIRSKRSKGHMLPSDL